MTSHFLIVFQEPPKRRTKRCITETALFKELCRQS